MAGADELVPELVARGRQARRGEDGRQAGLGPQPALHVRMCVRLGGWVGGGEEGGWGCRVK
jgi:hypothetical protein